MKKFIPVVVVGVVVLGVGFFGGVQYQKSHGRANILGAAGGQRGQFGVGGSNQGGAALRGEQFGAGGGFVAGEVLSKDDTSITVKLPAGGSSIVFFSPTTSIEMAASGSWNDIAVGTSVVVRGTQNADKTYTAQSVQLSRMPIRMQVRPVQPAQ